MQKKHRNRVEKKDAGNSNTLVNSAPSAFAVSSAFSTDGSTYPHKLKNCWTLDSATDVRICNDPKRFNIERVANSDDVLMSGKTIYGIDAYGTVDIFAKGPNGPVKIKLLNVLLAPGFMTNLVCLSKLTAKNVHWDTENDRLHYKGTTFCYTQAVGGHWVLEYNDPDEKEEFAAFAAGNDPRPDLVATGAEWHEMLGHPGPETIANLEKGVDGIKVTDPDSAPKSVQCETCALTKAHQIVSRRPGQEEPVNYPLGRVGYDLIQMTEAYNGDVWVSHFRDFYTGMDFVYTHPRKNDALSVIKEFLKMARTRYDQTVRFIRIDDERTLGLKYAERVKLMGITTERSAPYTPAQNGSTERSGGVLIIRARAMRISARLPANLWPEIFKTVGYLNNRTPKKALEWKTPLEALIGEKPKLSHLHPYGCRAYPLKNLIPRKEKLVPRAFIGYLIGYDSTNIFRIWIPSRMRVVRTRDVTFDHSRFYDPTDLDLGNLLTVTVEEVIEVLELPETSTFVGVVIEENDEEDEALVDEASQQTSESEDVAQPVDQAKEDAFYTSMEAPQILTPEMTPNPETSPQVLASPGPVQSSSDSSSFNHGTVDARPRRGRLVVETPSDSVAMSTRSRRQAYAAALITTSELAPYYSAFAVGLERPEMKKERLHRDSLPVEPRYWKQMLGHRFSQEFQLAAIKELAELEKRGTYQFVEKSDLNKLRIPLTWVFKYKFDTDGYLEKFRARLCARGDLQSTEQDTYAATLAAKTFRALMAVAAAFDLDLAV